MRAHKSASADQSRATEPIILVLILANAAILAYQSSAPLGTPRLDSGYFQGWPDFALFGLFVVFT